ncbi:MAG: hypothetical protein EBV34_11030 [Betaproteobacteria bacterium]|nr:hypothetical protein [Betaproteobacteria bacterium]
MACKAGFYTHLTPDLTRALIQDLRDAIPTADSSSFIGILHRTQGPDQAVKALGMTRQSRKKPSDQR